MGWIGVFGLVTCGAFLPVQRSFPGFLALYPVVSGALVIMAGRTNSRWGVDRWLVSKPLQSLGNISYALYLVHWPILILYSTAVEKPHVNFLEGTAIIAVSIALAWVLIQFVEKPLRYRKDPFIPWLMKILRFKRVFAVKTWADQLAFLAATFLLAGIPLAGAQAWVNYSNTQASIQAETQTQTATDNHLGARAIGTDQALMHDDPIPNGDLKNQYEMLSDGKCEGNFALSHDSLKKYCSSQKNGTDDSPLMMVVGNSHAEQAMAMFKPVAEQSKVNMQSILLGGCQYPQQDASSSNECAEFNRDITEEILQRKPQTVVIIATIAEARSNEERIDPALEETVKKFTDAGIQVVGVRDNPRYDYNVYECAQKAGDDLESCARPVSEKLAEKNPAQEVFDKYKDKGAVLVDMTDLYCPEGMCQPVVGNVYVYIDENHVSKAYGRTMAKTMLERAAKGGWIPTGMLSL